LDEHDPRVRRWFVRGLLLLTVVRLGIAGSLPLDISGDEAYYWEWGRHLDWGYFSKPPGIGWIMALVGWAGGDTAFGIRAFAVLLSSGTLWFLFRLAEALYGPTTALGAAMAFAATPASAVLALLLTPDPLLLLCWSSSLFFLWKFLEREGRSWRWGSALACSCSAGYLCKQMMLVFPVCAILYLGLSDRRGLKPLGIWLAVAMLSLAPTLAWNVRHDWLTFKSTAHHFEAQPITPELCAWRLAELVGSQLGLATPILWIVVVGSLWGATRLWRTLQDRERFLLLFSGPGLIFMLLATLRQRVNANWPAVFYLSAMVLAAGWVRQRWTPDHRSRSWAGTFQWGIVLAWTLTLLLYTAVYLPPRPLLRALSVDPTARLRGWSDIAGDVAAQRSRLPESPPLLYIAAGHRWLASTLAFYLPGHPRVYPFRHDPDRIESQHDLWQSPGAQLGRDAIVVIPGETNSLPQGLAACFQNVRLLARIEYPTHRPAYQIVSVFHGINLVSWPTNTPPGRRRLLLRDHSTNSFSPEGQSACLP
jgi:4-amino-4-deoxy-L-arabinose transferase-like glycosyltransferase